MSIQSSATLPPPNNDSRGPGVVACAVVLMVVSSIAVGLRFWSRFITTTPKLWWDDWSILATLIMSHAYLAFNIYWTTIGLGRHSWMIPKSQIAPNALANHVSTVLYFSNITLIKTSALLLYGRLFKSNRRFKIVLWTAGTVITIWWIMGSIIPWTACHPTRKVIDPFVKGKCDVRFNWFVSSAFINASLDFAVLVLPMPMVWRLHMKTKKKVFVTLVFVLGYGSAFISFARCIIIASRPGLLSASPSADISWKLIPLLYLSMLEAPIAILALCGPAINQLASQAGKFTGFTSLLTSSWRSLHGSSGSSNYREAKNSKSSLQKPSHWKPWSSGATSSTTAIAEHGEKEKGYPHMQEIPMGVISVEQDVEIAREREHHLV